MAAHVMSIHGGTCACLYMAAHVMSIHGSTCDVYQRTRTTPSLVSNPGATMMPSSSGMGT